MKQYKPWSNAPISGPLLRPPEASAYLGLALSTFYSGVKSGELPPLIKILPSGRASAIPKSWLDAMIASRLIDGAEPVS